MIPGLGKIGLLDKYSSTKMNKTFNLNKAKQKKHISDTLSAMSQCFLEN